jgi:hypothetical protein
MTEWINSAAGVATAVGVFLAWWQFRMTKIQARVAFEDQLASEYRRITEQLPVSALLGEELSDDDILKCLAAFYRYIDLTNEQIFLRMQGRISESTWWNWRDGIRAHLGRPAFQRAWTMVAARTADSFQELRRLETSRFLDDPRAWMDTRPARAARAVSGHP